ncbi:MAG: sigma-70 family RNA polymerase sigma factor [Bacteroidia bacterium]|nr:sigma-70 family RNA polymerase sigma factor [Bacteroidia bacterium]
MEKFTPAKLQRPLKDEQNLSILKGISNAKNDKVNGDQAFNEFYYRFHRYVWNVAYRVCSNFSKDSAVAEDLFQEVFKRVYLKADLLVKGKEGEISDVTIKAWLGKIANNALMDYIRGNEIENQGVELVIGVHEGRDYQPDEEIQEVVDVNLATLQAVMEKLPEKEKEILYLYLYNTEKKVSSADLKRLAEKHGIKSDSIRRTYYRILDDLKKQLKK